MRSMRNALCAVVSSRGQAVHLHPENARQSRVEMVYNSLTDVFAS